MKPSEALYFSTAYVASLLAFATFNSIFSFSEAQSTLILAKSAFILESAPSESLNDISTL